MSACGDDDDEWLLPATDYVSEETTTQQQPQQQVADSEELKKLLQEVLKQELAPIRRSIAMANDRKPGFHDIIGGIGYLLGLAGLVAWLRNRKPVSRPTE